MALFIILCYRLFVCSFGFYVGCTFSIVHIHLLHVPFPLFIFSSHHLIRCFTSSVFFSLAELIHSFTSSVFFISLPYSSPYLICYICVRMCQTFHRTVVIVSLALSSSFAYFTSCVFHCWDLLVLTLGL